MFIIENVDAYRTKKSMLMVPKIGLNSIQLSKRV